MRKATAIAIEVMVGGSGRRRVVAPRTARTLKGKLPGWCYDVPRLKVLRRQRPPRQRCLEGDTTPRKERAAFK